MNVSSRSNSSLATLRSEVSAIDLSPVTVPQLQTRNNRATIPIQDPLIKEEFFRFTFPADNVGVIEPRDQNRTPFKMYTRALPKQLQSTRPGPNTRCQKCLKYGHHTYQCTNSRPYASRPSHSQQLASGDFKRDKPSVEVPDEFKAKDAKVGLADKILKAKEEARARVRAEPAKSKKDKKGKKRAKTISSESESESDSASDSESDSDSASSRSRTRSPPPRSRQRRYSSESASPPPRKRGRADSDSRSISPRRSISRSKSPVKRRRSPIEDSREVSGARRRRHSSESSERARALRSSPRREATRSRSRSPVRRARRGDDSH